MGDAEREQRGFKGYDYKEIVVENSKMSQYIDGYNSFGWDFDDNQNFDKVNEYGKIKVRLKRDRKIMNKVELTRLERHFESCMNQIGQLEKSKTTQATAAALSIGIIGTAFMAGSVFAIVNDPPLIWLCILLAIPACLGWISPYFVYLRIRRRRMGIVEPFIEEKYDEMYEICEKGCHLLGKD